MSIPMSNTSLTGPTLYLNSVSHFYWALLAATQSRRSRNVQHPRRCNYLSPSIPVYFTVYLMDRPVLHRSYNQANKFQKTDRKKQTKRKSEGESYTQVLLFLFPFRCIFLSCPISPFILAYHITVNVFSLRNIQFLIVKCYEQTALLCVHFVCQQTESSSLTLTFRCGIRYRTISYR